VSGLAVGFTPRSRVEYPSPIQGKNRSPTEDDPEQGIFWGPKQPNAHYTRWSRPWFDWRNDLELARKL
jgi:hypothetical protein